MIRPAARRVLLVVAPLCWLVAMVGTMSTSAQDGSVPQQDLAFTPVEIQIAADTSASPTTTPPAVADGNDPPAPWALVAGGAMIGLLSVARFAKRPGSRRS